MRIRPLLIALTLAGGLAVAPAATAATASASTRASNPGPIVGVHGLHGAVGVHLPQTSLPRAGSDNQPWSGYVDVADPNVALRYVASSFNVPTLRCPSSGQADVSIWVGINGLNQTNGT